MITSYICMTLAVLITGIAEIRGHRFNIPGAPGYSGGRWGNGYGANRRECLDVAIIGGGIGGTYAGWRLRNRGLKIAIFENTNRIGGRMFSVFLPSVPNVPADLGAMRYLPGVHTTLESLFPKLGLRSQVFQPDQFKKVYYLRGKRLSAEQLDSPELPYNLAPGESRNQRLLRWTLSQRALNVSEPDKISDIEEAVTPDGVPVYKKGYLNLMDLVWSNEAKEYLKHLDPFYTLYNPTTNAAHMAVADNPTSVPQDTWTVVGGMNAISKRLAEQFVAASYRHTINLNGRIHSIMKVRSGVSFVYQLKIYESQTVDGFTKDKQVEPHTVYAKHVILALPPKALKNIQWYPLQHDTAVQVALNAVNDLTAMKIFLAYPHAWWDSFRVNNKAFVTNLPLRQGGEFGRFRNASGHETAMMMVSYADGDDNKDILLNFQDVQDIISSSTVPAAFSVSRKVVQHLHHHLGTIYNVSSNSIPWPLDGVMQIWDDQQNGRAWQLFKPGYQPKAVANFIRRPSNNDQVFVVTNAFSRRFFGWGEGCLRAVDSVLREFFNMP